MEVDPEPKAVCIPKNIAVLLDDDKSGEWINAIVALKNDVIGSNREKMSTINCGLIPRLLKWIEDESAVPELRTQAAIVLASVARGAGEAINALIEHKSVPTLLKSLDSLNQRFTEALLRCLRSIFAHSVDCSNSLYEENRFGSTYIPHLLSLVHCSTVCQECITSILERGCQTQDHQKCLLESGVLNILAPLLTSKFYKVQMPTVRCFANLCYRNLAVCAAVMKVEEDLIPVFVELMGRDKPSEMQMASAKVLTYLYRGGAIPATEVISRKTLGTLVRMCKRDRPLDENVKGAETLACLIELDPELQMTASITDHLISTLAKYLQFKDVKKVSSSDNKEVDWGSEMKRAAFLAFASITANDEEIREKVIKKEGFMEQVQSSLASHNDAEVIASLKCLHSLTRSVQQMRTVLHDSSIWKPIVDMIQSPCREKVLLAMGCVCNLSLEFSPSREAMLQNNALEILMDHCQSQDPAMRFNATWCIMSLAYGSVDPLRESLINCMKTEVMLARLEDELPTVREKALGIVRNLITNKHNIDKTVNMLGSEVIEAVFGNIRDGTMPIDVAQQALCVISNMADGPSCKAHIIGKPENIFAVIQYLQVNDQRVQLPAIQFINNLVDSAEDGSYQRMLTLKNLGVQVVLEGLIGTSTEEVEKRAQQTLKLFA